MRGSRNVDDYMARTESPSSSSSPIKGSDPSSRVQRLIENLSKPGTAQELRLSIAKTHREMLKELRPVSAGGNYTSISALTHLLEHRFGSITAAWRSILDPNMKGKASFSDFCSACRDVGFLRKIKPLWKQLTENRPQSEQGYIELEHLDAEAAAAVKEFRLVNRQRHGSMEKAWQWFDAKKKTRVDIVDFRDCFLELGIAHDVEKTFHLLKLDPSRPYLLSQDFEDRVLQCCYREDIKNKTWKSNYSLSQSKSDGTLMLSMDRQSMSTTLDRQSMSTLTPFSADRDVISYSPMSKSSSTGDLRPSTSESMGSTLRPSTSESMGSTALNGTRLSSTYSSASSGFYKSQKVSREREAQARSLEELRQLLVIRFGSQYDAWRHNLDVNDHGRLAFGEFCEAVRRIGFQGNLKDVWQALVPDKGGFVSLHLLDPSTSECIDSYKALAKRKFGCLLQAWGDLDPRGTGMVDEIQFVRHCASLGWTGPRDARSLFHLLKHEKERKFMTLKEYDMKAYSAWNRGHVEMLSPENAERKVSLMDFQQRQDATFTQRWARMAVKLDREDIDKHNEVIAPHMGHQDAKALKELLIRKHGTITAGWKHSIDLHRTGRVAFGELCIALRRLGFCGKPRDVFAELMQATASEEMAPEGKGKDEVNKQKISSSAAESTTRESVIAGDEQFLQSAIKERQRTSIVAHDSSLELKAAEKDVAFADDVVRSIQEKKTIWTDALEKQMELLREAGMHGAGCVAALQKVVSLGEKAGADAALVQHFREACHRKAGERLDVDGIVFSRMEKTLMDQIRIISEQLEAAEDDKASKMGIAEEVRFKAEQNNTDAEAAAKAVEKAMASESLAQQDQSQELDVTTAKDKAIPKGFLTLANFDIAANAMLKEFRELLVEQYGTYTKAWQVFDTHRSNAVEEAQFIEACGKIGFSKDSKLLFKYLLEGPGKTVIRLADLDPTSFQEYQRGTMDTFQPLEKAKAEALHTSALREANSVQQKAEQAKRMVASDWKTFKVHLIRKYGTIVAAWRNGLDYSGNGKLSFTEFSKACRFVGFSGDVRKMFNELDIDGSGIITLNEVEPRWYVLLEDFHSKLLAKYQTYQSAWRALDSSGRNGVDEGDFIRACKDLGYVGDAKDRTTAAKELFDQLKSHRGQLTLSLPDIEAKGCAIFGVTTATPSAKHKSKGTSTGYKFVLSDWRAFKTQLVERYGTLDVAWRDGLAPSGNDELSFIEFSKSCLRMGYIGDAHKVFDELDVNKRGAISFSEVESCVGSRGANSSPNQADAGITKDQSSHARPYKKRDSQMLKVDDKAKILLREMDMRRKKAKDKHMAPSSLECLKQLLIRRYGTITAAWRHGLDFSGNGKLSFVEFSKACRDVGFAGNIKAAFVELNKDQKGIVTFNELDPGWYEKLASFRELLIGRYGKLDHKCMHNIDRNGNNTIEIEDLQKTCEEIGYQHDAGHLFEQLKKDPHRKFITMDDIRAKGVITSAVDRFSDDRSLSPTNSLWSPSASIQSASPKRSQLERSLELSQPVSPKLHPTRYFCSGC